MNGFEGSALKITFVGTVEEVFSLIVQDGEGIEDLTFCLDEGRYEVNAVNYEDDNRTALALAADEGNLEAVRLLIQAGANVQKAFEGKDKDVTPLHLASEEDQAQIAQALIDAKANFNALDRYLRTPLWYAAKSGAVNALRVLLSSNADPNLADGDYDDEQKRMSTEGEQIDPWYQYGGISPLIVAAQEGHLEVAKALVEHGVDVDFKSNNRQSAVDVAYDEVN